jgi:hypothetical protein
MILHLRRLGASGGFAEAAGRRPQAAQALEMGTVS